MFRQFHPRFSVLVNAEEETAHQFSKSGQHRHRGSSDVKGQKPHTRRGDIKFMLLELFSERPQHEAHHSKSGQHRHRGSSDVKGQEPRTRRDDIKFMLLELFSERPQHNYELIKKPKNRRGGFRRHNPGSIHPKLQMLEEGGNLTSEQVEGKDVHTITESGRPLLRDRTQQADSRNTNDSFLDSKPSELIELRQTLTELNDAVTQIARSGNLEQALRVRDLLVQVKHEIDKFPVEQ